MELTIACQFGAARRAMGNIRPLWAIHSGKQGQ